MPIDVSPKRMQDAVHRGFDRFKNFRRARLLFLRGYTGPYYDQAKGDVGEEALNLIFNAVRTLVPNIVANFPSHSIESHFVWAKEYGELLELALQYHDKAIDITSLYRRVIVDAIFTLGIIKTGLTESDSVYSFGEDGGIHIDAGEIYSEVVDFDDLVVDGACKEHLFKDAQWIGDRITLSRSTLLESGLYRNDLVERLASAGDQPKRNTSASDLSRRSLLTREDWQLQDEVDIVELWVPGANAVVTVPGQKGTVFDEYLRVDDYYGPDTGPYTFLALTPPVPGNPLPIPMVGIWNDLHVLANRMAKKITDQAERQKDVVTYRRNVADDAQAMLDAKDGEAIATDDPDGVRVLSFGGQQQSNEVYLAQVQNWFNTMAANPQGVGGQRFDADSATEVRILQSNASVGLEDMKDLVYQMASKEARNRAWYLHTDPFINLPLIRRVMQPAEYVTSALGPQMVRPAQNIELQVFLTPEARRGDWLDFTFSIEPESMGRKDRQTRLREAMEFAVKIIPAVVLAGQNMALMGMPFSVKALLLRMAKAAGITWMEEVFYDPEYQMAIAQMMMQGPQAQGSKGEPTQRTPNAGIGSKAILQNGQPGQVGAVAGAGKVDRQGAQEGANQDQSMMRTGT